MNLRIEQPGQVFRNVSRIAALGADRKSRARLAQAMLRANLKRLHRGWSRVSNRILGRRPLRVQLALPETFPFWYRPGTTDLLVLEQVFLDGEYQLGKIDSSNVEYIVDCGSNIGVTALYWAQRFPLARIALIEPDAVNFELLRRNTESIRDRVTLIRAAIAERDGKATLYRSNREYSHSTIPTDDCIGSDSVAALSIATALEAAEFPRVDLLKMDIEGGEDRVMGSLPSWSDVPRYLLAEIHPPYGAATFARDCEKSGLEATAVEPGRENLVFAARA